MSEQKQQYYYPSKPSELVQGMEYESYDEFVGFWTKERWDWIKVIELPKSIVPTENKLANNHIRIPLLTEEMLAKVEGVEEHYDDFNGPCYKLNGFIIIVDGAGEIRIPLSYLDNSVAFKNVTLPRLQTILETLA